MRKSLERAGITCNKNGIPFDPEKPAITSGIRLGSPAATSRGFGAKEFQIVGELVVNVIDGLAGNNGEANDLVEARVNKTVRELCNQFPIYSSK